MQHQFRPIQAGDRADIAAISHATWEGNDFLEAVFDHWIGDASSHFVGVEVDGRIVGCARLLPLDAERIWLEGLRVHPAAQGLGLGREMAHYTFRLAIELGFNKLLFSTYFGNHASIRISEAVGFHPVAIFSLLEAKLEELKAADGGGASPGETGQAGLSVGFRRLPGWIVNDWLFLPADLPRPEPFFVEPVVVSDGTLTMLLADSRKESGHALEICSIEGPIEADPFPCLARIGLEARRRGRTHLHLMLPEERPIAPYLRAGFRSYERSLDVLVYEAKTGDLQLATPPYEA